ncbi:MAG TPA: triose-phosphate isomerase family protein [Propionibacteriaceae bacterium]|nr:triose-phosphate isomerase family protein [Propionibacteriaceae bacterium]
MADGPPQQQRRLVAVGHKAYLGYAETLAWLEAAAGPAQQARDVDVVVFPVALALPAAMSSGRDAYAVGAQDLSDRPAGAFTGELPAALLSEVGVRYVEIGHAERRFLFGDTPDVVARKIAVAVEHGLTPLVCVGEGRLGDTEVVPVEEAIEQAGRQLAEALERVPGGTELVVAYEPVWAIGAEEPAGVEHITRVAAGLRPQLSAHQSARLIYGGTAGPGLFAHLREAVDGLFLGRRAHSPAAFADILGEVATV